MPSNGLSKWLVICACAVLRVEVAPGAPAPPKEDAPAVIAKDLMPASVFPEAQFGMAVESAEDGSPATVVTTGAEFLIDAQKGTIECRQRISAQRSVATVQLPSGSLGELKRTHQSSGAAIFEGPGATIRINGDSLIMVQPKKAGPIRATINFTPDFHARFKGNMNFYDPVGGVSFFEHGQWPQPQIKTARDPIEVTWNWKANEVFWASVSPPKPFDWERSLNDRVICHGSEEDRYMYPDDLMIRRCKVAANATVLYLHNEMMWEHWQLSMVPKNKAEFARVINTAHENELKVAVYASPKMLLKGTAAEHLAQQNARSPTGTGWHTGSNEAEYLKQAERVIKEFKADGLYFDEMYGGPKALATQYHLARSARNLVGAGGLLYYHCTEDVLADRRGKSGVTACPTIHAYFDLLLKGEAEADRIDPAYTRYVLGSYNLSNTPTVQVADDRVALDPQRIDHWIRFANARLFFLASWFHTERADLFRDHYWARLTQNRPNLKFEIEPDLLRPTGVFAQARQLAKSKE
jgi:hypothetical protein